MAKPTNQQAPTKELSVRVRTVRAHLDAVGAHLDAVADELAAVTHDLEARVQAMRDSSAEILVLLREVGRSI